MWSLTPRGDSSYEKRQDFSSASNIAAFTSYMARQPDAANQAYNIVDNDPAAVTFRDLWEFMGQYFGVPVVTKVGFDIEKDIHNKLGRGVWHELVGKHGGDRDACEKFATWPFFGWIMRYSTWAAHVSMKKAAKEIGWTTQCDTRGESKKIFDTMRSVGVIPDLPTP